jgi:hypothetical protein
VTLVHFPAKMVLSYGIEPYSHALQARAESPD